MRPDKLESAHTRGRHESPRAGPRGAAFPARFPGYQAGGPRHQGERHLRQGRPVHQHDPRRPCRRPTGLEGPLHVPARDGQRTRREPILPSPSSPTAITCSRAPTPMRACAFAGRPTSWKSRWTRRRERSLVTKVVNVNDVGKVISWEGCEGQQYGGTYHGCGQRQI